MITIRSQTIEQDRCYRAHLTRCTSAILLPACTLLILGLACGLAGAVDYGAIDVTPANCAEWSTNLSNNDSTVTGNIIVKSGAALHLSNATILMDNGHSINVKSGATLNVTDGSNITRHDSSYYYFNYESGSYGKLNDSTIEYSSELQIATANNITVTNCTIRNNQNHGVHLTSTSGYVNITDCRINNTVSSHGIFIKSSQGNILRDNSLNNNSGNYSLYVTGDYDQNIDTTNTVNGGRVYYNYTDSGTITDTDIGHVTIVDCSDLWFTGCMIHNGDGIRIRGVSSNVSIRDSTIIENNTVYGIKFESTSWNNITSVTIENNTEHGVYFVDSSNNLINDSSILDNSNYGVHSKGSSDYNRIINNSITGNTAGIHLTGAGHNNITDNNVAENTGNGICIGSYDAQPSDNTIRNNTILSNGGTGVIFYSNNNDLSENNISDNTNWAFQFVDQYYNNYLWRNNTANREEVNYYYNEHDMTLDPKNLSASNVSNVGKITLIDCTNITIRDSELSNNIKSSSYGIFLWNSDNNDLTNNTISNNYYGIRLHASSNNDITDLDTVSPSKQYGAQFDSDSDYNNIIYSSFAATTSNGMLISSSDHTTITDTTISSVSADGVYVGGSYTTLTNVTITSTNADGLYTSGDYTTITESEITAGGRGVYCHTANHTDIIDTTITAGTDGIYMSRSHWGNLTNNTINATERGIFLTTSRDHNLTANNITNYTIIGILLEEYSTNTTMIGNDLTRNGSELDIRINDSNGAAIANNESTAANYTFYLTNDTRLCTLDTVFDKTKVGYEDTSNLTLMWRIDVLCWDNYHEEPMWTNLTVRYSDLSDANGLLCWEGGTANANGRLSNNAFGDYGPPTSSSNWLPIIEYKQNASGKTTYQPMNCTAINQWDVLQEIYGRSYRNVTTRITEPGVTVLVDAGYTPNGKCYYCHVDKLKYADGTFKFPNTTHWTMYDESIRGASPDDPYTPGRCIDCHDEDDSIAIPHGNASGKDLLYNQSPQLCYTGRTGELSCHSVDATPPLDQEREFSRNSSHPLEDGKLACKSCHDNHGTDERYDLLKYYTNGTNPDTGSSEQGYDSSYYALCLVCHLEEKIVAMMSGETDSHLQNYTNQTNFRDEYYGWGAGFASSNNPKNIHSPQTESDVDAYPHAQSNCYSCHNPHGSDNPATTRYRSKDGGGTCGDNAIFNYTYITNVSPLDNTAWEVLDYANWNDSTMNKGGGTYDSNCGCHNWYKLKNDFFNYREFIDYEPAGGAGCLECHDNGRSGAIRPIVNLSAVKIAMHTNLSWWAEEDVDTNLPGTNKNFTKWLGDRGYANTNLDRNNSICWACHSTNGTPPSPGYHPDRALNPYKCPKCHGPYDGQPPHTQGLVAAIDNHGPTTKGAELILIQTDVGSGGSCGYCHAPSKLPNSSIGDLKVWKYTPSKNFVDYNGRTTMGDVSHYGLNRSQGIDILGSDSPHILCDTTNCLFCHCNWTNGQIWGNATNISGNMYGADTTNLSTCYTYCHVRPDWAGVNNSTLSHFHNKSIYAGGGPNCVLCHDVDSDYGVQSLVNSTSIKMGIHGNILNNTLVSEGYGMDNRSNPCWGCHNSDGTIPEGMGDRNGITDVNDDGVITADEMPYTCEDCHARSDVWNSATSDGETWQSASDPDLGLNKLPPVIYTHYPNSSTLKTDMNGKGRCVDCHNNSIDSHRNDTAEKIIGNTIFANVSHYSTTADLIYPTEVCAICHHNATNGTIWGDAPQNTHGNWTDYSNPEDGCYICHTNDNETPVDLHAANLWSGQGGFDCLRCHDEEGFAKGKRVNGSVFGEAIHKDVNNASNMAYGLNRSCWACHFENATNADKHSMRKKPPYLCYDCHRKTGPPFTNVSDAPEVHNHFKNGTNISAYWGRPTDSDSCMGCHNISEMFYPFTENDTYRTNFSITSHYGNNRTDLVDLYNETNYSNDYCAYCHSNSSTPFVELNPLKHINHYGSQTCDECHGPGRLHNSTLTRVLTDANCTNCHATYGSHQPGLKYKINVTAVNLGVHANVNSNMNATAETKTNDVNNSKCWGCHVPGGAWPEDGHRGTFNNDAYLCYDCHNGTYAYDNVNTATAVYNHFKSGANITACTQADSNSESCGYGCHNFTSMKVPGFDEFAGSGQAEYRLNMSQSSHYPRNRTDIIIDDDLSDCTWCHRNSTNEFISIFLYAGYPNYTENIPHATKTSGCIVPECHDRGRIHDSSLKIPTLNWSEACKSCHFELNDSDAYVNETMFNASVHETVDCTECHVNEEMNHPIEEYTWKWCECCHAYQSDPLNESDRHNVTADPANYSAKGVNVLTITECTECHNATAYENAKANFNANAEHECRWCHSYPD